MIAYHGCPITPESDAAKILAGRHALVSFAHPEQLDLVAAVCASFVLDNGAWSLRDTIGTNADWEKYYAWVDEWSHHPGFDWAIIPDVINGDEDDNRALIDDWPFIDIPGVPVWHLHESLEYLDMLCTSFPRVAFGSSGKYKTPGSDLWWHRMAEAMDEVVCDELGRPRVKLHLLRGLDPKLFTRLPVSSADSSTVARNIGLDVAWKGTYAPANKAARGTVIAERIEAQQSAARWTATARQTLFALEGG